VAEPLFPDGAVLVVGGTGGIGRAICTEFARSGTDVALTYRSRKEAADELADSIRSMGRKATVHHLTLSNLVEVESAVIEAEMAHGRVHTVVMSAGSLATQSFISQLSPQQWQRVMNEDLNGFFNVLHTTLPRLKAGGGGSYVHIGTAGHVRWPGGDVLSVAPKAAIESLITGIASEEGRHNIRANSVLLGVIEAGMFLELQSRGDFDEHWIKSAQRNVAIKRWGQPEEVAYACVFLASARAAYLTGQRLSVSGGYGL
jgi:NAD(P)-dependent dehydrogenase (short-subunit alcohol dehydrogenase family)